VVPIPAVRCHSCNCAVRCYCVRDNVRSLQKTPHYLHWEKVEETETNGGKLHLISTWLSFKKLYYERDQVDIIILRIEMGLSDGGGMV